MLIKVARYALKVMSESASFFITRCRSLEKPFNNADLMLTAKSGLDSFRNEGELLRQLDELVKANAELNFRLAYFRPPTDGARFSHW